MSLFAKQQNEHVKLQAFMSDMCAMTGEGGFPSWIDCNLSKCFSNLVVLLLKLFPSTLSFFSEKISLITGF